MTTTPISAVDLIDNWLTTKQTVLWGSTWDVTNLAEMRRVVKEEVR